MYLQKTQCKLVLFLGLQQISLYVANADDKAKTWSKIDRFSVDSIQCLIIGNQSVSSRVQICAGARISPTIGVKVTWTNVRNLIGVLPILRHTGEPDNPGTLGLSAVNTIPEFASVKLWKTLGQADTRSHRDSRKRIITSKAALRDEEGYRIFET